MVYESQEFVLSLLLREDISNTSRTKMQFFTNITSGSATSVDVSVTDVEIAGNWIHAALVFTRDGNNRTMTAYVNGIERGSTTFTTALDLSPNPDFFHIGTARDVNLSPSFYFKGRIDDVAIWDRTLGGPEIAAIATPQFNVNNDGVISITDLADVKTAALYDSTDTEKDVNNDGIVNDTDVLLVSLLVSAIGVESKTVDTLADDGSANSLRTILTNAKASPGTHITFAPGIAGGTIMLGSEQLFVPEGKEVYIDGGDAGITIDANGSVTDHRVIEVKPSATVALHGLTLTGGKSRNVHPLNSGGAILNNDAILRLSACTISRNEAQFGGAIYSEAVGGSATLSLSSCTVSGNEALRGGGIYSNGTGGQTATVNLNSCTISGNSADDSGGGIYSIGRFGNVLLNLNDTILAANTAPAAPDLIELEASGTVTTSASGSNLMSSIAGSKLPADPENITIISPASGLKLAPLGDYGGPTMTMPPLTGSPAINGATTSTSTVDQRGFSIVGIADIGAAESRASDTTITWNPAAITYSTNLTSSLNATASPSSTLTYDRTPSEVLNAGDHQLTAIASPNNPETHNPAVKTVTLTIQKLQPSITWPFDHNITYGTMQGINFTATSNLPGTFNYIIDSSQGFSATSVPEVGNYTMTYIFTPTDTANHTGGSDSKALTVAPALLTITADDKQRAAGAANPPFTATYAGFVGSDTVNDLDTLPVIDSNATPNAPPGLIAITVTGGSDNNYEFDRRQGLLTVLPKVVPTITWNNPAAITFGTALSSTQLNASASTAGTFSYDPAVGTTLNAGTHTLTVNFTPTDSAAFTGATKTVTLTINKATPVITWSNPAAITYGTALGGTQFNASSTAPGTITYSPASGVINAGTHQLTANLAESDNFVAASKQVNLTVTPAALTITADNKQRGAGVANPTLTASYSGLTNGDTAPATLPSLSTPAVIDSEPGTYPITISGGSDPNYTVTRVNGTLTVASKQVPVITWNNPAAITFGATLGATQLNATADVPGTFSYSPTTGATLDAGTQTLTATFTPTNSAAFASASKTVTLTVNKATPTITWTNPAAITYGTALGGAQLNASSSAPGTLTYSPASGVLNAGTHVLTANLAESDNFVAASKTVNLTVNAAPLTITADNKQRAAGDANPTLTVSYSGLTNGDTAPATLPSLSTTAVIDSEPGPYPITVSGGADPNYTITRTNGTLTVASKQVPVITWSNPAAITFGETLGATQLNASANVEGTFSYSPTTGATLDAGTQTLTATFTPTNSAAFASASKTVSLTVNKATPTITWSNPAAIIYGTALGGAQLNASSSAPGTLTYSPASGVLNAGTHVLTANLAESDNFVAASKTVSLTVNAAPLTITADNKQRGAGIANPTLTASYSGLTNGDTAPATLPSLSTTAVIDSEPGTYPITVSGGADPNYTITRTNGTLTIASKQVPVLTWSNPAAITFGATLGATQLNATADVPGTFSYSPTTGATLDAGTQTLTATFTPTNSAAFASASKTVTLTVNKATPTITWTNPAAITYGTALGGAQLNASSTAPGTITYSPASGVLNAGTHVLTANLAESDNFVAASKTVNLTVNAAALTITADNQQRGAGVANPMLTASYSGLVNGDTAPATPPSLSTTAVVDSEPGSYPITVSGGADPNYDIARVNGTLTIASKQVPVITWNNPAAITFGTTLGATQLNATADVPGTFSYSPTTGATLDAGTQSLTVNFTPTDSAAIATASKTVTLTINKATPTITWSNPAAITYGTALGGSQLDASTTAPGTLAFSPATGTALGAGNAQQLQVTFTPSDGNFESATKTVSIDVNKAPLTITAEDKQRGAGIANPSLTASFSGFVNGDTTLATPPSLTTTATTSSAAGSYPITISGGDDPNYAITRINGTLTVSAKELPVVTWSNPAAITYGTALGSTQLNATANVDGTFSYVPASGTVLDAGNSQTLTATFTPANSAAFASATKTVTINVDKATPTITWSAPAAITYGTTLSSSQLNATSTEAGTLSYSPAIGTVLGAGNSQQLSVTFPASANFNTASKTVSINVNKAPLTITAEGKQRGAGIANPTLTASYSGFVNGDTASDLTTPVSLSTTATTASAAGSYPITANGATSADYAITFVPGTLTVSSKEVPVIAWSNPAAIAYGTALTATQLNASSATPGSYTYNPPLGTVLAAGNGQTLTVNFIPTDGAAFASASQNVQITINPKALTIRANNASRKEGTSNPAFTASYTGLTNGDSAPSSPPTLSTTATSDSTPGTYPITINGGSDPNYTITRIDGTLTVTEGNPVEPTEAPQLFITRIGNQLAVSWQLTEGWTLHESETLIDWEPVNEQAVEQEGEMLLFGTPATGPKLYFRLERR